MMLTVTTAAELTAALDAATGGETIELVPGNYGKLTVTKVFGSEVTIQSADPANKAVFSELLLNGAAWLTFRDIVFDATDPGLVAWGTPFRVKASSNISFFGSVFDGVMVPGTAGDPDGWGTGIGLQITDGSSHVLVSGCEFFNWNSGINPLQSNFVTIDGNDIHHIRADSIHIQGTSDLIITNNHIHDPNKAVESGDHPDFIQIWNPSDGALSSRVLIDSNFFNSGDGGWVQTIFMGGPQGTDIAVTNNLIHNGHPHGISTGSASQVLIEYNTLLFNEYGSVWGGPTINAGADCIVRNNVALGSDLPAGNLVISYTAGEPNYVGDLYVNPLAGKDATLADLQAIAGGIIETDELGSSLTRGGGAVEPPVEEPPVEEPPAEEEPTNPDLAVMQAEIDALKVAVADLAARVEAAENATGTLADRVTAVEQPLTALDARVGELETDMQALKAAWAAT